jgi:RNA recognition motif-containing protein
MRCSNGPLKLFVGDLGDNRKSDLNRLFSKYGEISTIYIDENKHFAFVEFTSSKDAQRALERTNNKTINGSKLRVEYAKSDKASRDNRRPLSRDRSPTSVLYSHLQVTANRLPPMQTFRQSYYQHYPPGIIPDPPTMSRGRSLTPPSFKQSFHLPSMHHLRSQDLYYQHPAIYSDPAYYRTYGDPYLMQRLPPPPPSAFLPPTSSPPSRAYRNTYSSSGIDRYTGNRHRRSRSRSRRRTSSLRRNRTSRERKRKRRTSSPSSPQQKRGPRTPPPSSKSSTNRSKKRSRSGSDTVASTSERKSSSNSSSDDEEKPSSSTKSADDGSNRKHSKRKTRE